MSQDQQSYLQLHVGLDQEEADHFGLGGTYYHWCPGGCIFPRDVVAVVINLPIRLSGVVPEDPNKPCYLPFKFILGEDFRLTGNYHYPTINPAISWNNTCGHVVNGKLLEHPEHKQLKLNA